MHLTIYPNDLALIEEDGKIEIGSRNIPMRMAPVPKMIDPSSFRVHSSSSVIRMSEFILRKPLSEDDDADPDLREILMVFDAPEGEWPCRFSYITSGVSWSSSYSITIRGDEADVSLYASIVNGCGADLEEAQVHLVSRHDAPGTFASYDIIRMVDLPHDVVKHIELFNVGGIPLDKRYVAPHDEDGVLVKRSIRNDEDSGLGYDIPPGDVRVYEETGPDGKINYIDSFRFPSIPAGSIMEILSMLTDEIEIVGEWDRYGTASIVVSNRTGEDAVVEIEERCPFDDLILSNSHNFIRRDDNTIAFMVGVKASGSSVLTYTVDPSLIDREWGGDHDIDYEMVDGERFEEI